MMKWNKRSIATVLCLLLGCSFSLSSATANELKRFDQSSQSCRTLGFESYWYGKGRRLFDKKCKVCHTRNSKTNAPFLYSESKPGKGWNRVFFKKYPKCAKAGEWKITKDEALLINDYLFRYSANTHDANVAS